MVWPLCPVVVGGQGFGVFLRRLCGGFSEGLEPGQGLMWNRPDTPVAVFLGNGKAALLGLFPLCDGIVFEVVFRHHYVYGFIQAGDVRQLGEGQYADLLEGIEHGLETARDDRIADPAAEHEPEIGVPALHANAGEPVDETIERQVVGPDRFREDEFRPLGGVDDHEFRECVVRVENRLFAGYHPDDRGDQDGGQAEEAEETGASEAWIEPCVEHTLGTISDGRADGQVVGLGVHDAAEGLQATGWPDWGRWNEEWGAGCVRVCV